MKKIVCFFMLVMAFQVYAETRFYRQYWAEFKPEISNLQDGRWRVNDSEIALHDYFGTRYEVHANGLVLLNIDEDLFDLDKAEIYLELWGGHPHTAGKYVSVNGRGVYQMPDYGAREGHCVYSYPVIEVERSHLVRGANALQFSADRGHSFWGHYIIDNVAVRCILNQDSLFVHMPDYKEFKSALIASEMIKNEKVALKLEIPEKFTDEIHSVDYFARYTDFDDNGDLDMTDWHGYTYKKEYTHHIGNAHSPSEVCVWDMTMIPDQSQPIAFKAIVRLKNGLFYETEPTTGSLLLREDYSVQLYHCIEAPVPFWSRTHDIKTGIINIPVPVKQIKQAQLEVKIWDGGEGEEKHPFKINETPVSITSGKAIHDVVHTVADLNPEILKNGKNTVTLISETHHHGIEILRPGPCIRIRFIK